MGPQPASTDSSSPQAMSGTNISEHILDFLFENGESIPSVTATYFRTIDVWLPVISRERIQMEFEHIKAANTSELAILLLSMYLITRVHTSNDRSTMDTPLYREAKALHSMQASSGESGIETVQAGLLLCLYEHGHGMFEAAQLSMATTSRLGMRILNANRRQGVEHIQDTEVGHLWWGIEILDKYVCLNS